MGIPLSYIFQTWEVYVHNSKAFLNLFFKSSLCGFKLHNFYMIYWVISYTFSQEYACTYKCNELAGALWVCLGFFFRKQILVYVKQQRKPKNLEMKRMMKMTTMMTMRTTTTTMMMMMMMMWMKWVLWRNAKKLKQHQSRSMGTRVVV